MVLIRAINWPAGCDICAFKPCVPHGRFLVPMSCCKCRLVWGVNFAVHAKLAKLWSHTDLIYTHHLTITHVSTTFYCSKRDVTMVSGIQVTLHTPVRITTTTKCDDSFWKTFGKMIWLSFYWKGIWVPPPPPPPPHTHTMHLENGDLRIWYVLFQTKMKFLLRALWNPDRQDLLLQSFDRGNFVFKSCVSFKATCLNEIEKTIPIRVGLVKAMSTDACWGRHFRVEAGIFVLNRAFFYLIMHFAVEAGFFVSNECFDIE